MLPTQHTVSTLRNAPPNTRRRLRTPQRRLIAGPSLDRRASAGYGPPPTTLRPTITEPTDPYADTQAAVRVRDQEKHFGPRGNQFEAPQDGYLRNIPQAQRYAAPAEGPWQQTPVAALGPLDTVDPRILFPYGQAYEAVLADPVSPTPQHLSYHPNEYAALHHHDHADYPPIASPLNPGHLASGHGATRSPFQHDVEPLARPQHHGFEPTGFHIPPTPIRPSMQTATGWRDRFDPADLPVSPPRPTPAARLDPRSNYTPSTPSSADYSRSTASRPPRPIPPTPPALLASQTSRPPAQRLPCLLGGCPGTFSGEYERTRHRLVVHAQARQHFHCTAPGCAYEYPRLDTAATHCRTKHDAGEGGGWMLVEVTDEDLVRDRGCRFAGCTWYARRLPYLSLHR
ncbi:hypothetical protein LTR53_001307 [Teratosphaeriaceae sp. CCFEE 6253]|nr:hypothetical protein LTR53_001307 [Teratosphaeriaceae sp. CCFEE 6253]